MDTTGDANSLVGPSLVFLTFLQQKGCKNDDFERELTDLKRDLIHDQDINCNGVGLVCADGSLSRELHSGDDGELQTDGHSPTVHLQMFVRAYHPLVQAPPPPVPVPDPALRDIAQELIQIADQLENDVMARATNNLLRSLQNSEKWKWSSHLKQAVEHVHVSLRCGNSLGDLPQERVALALSLSLIKGVCEHTPRFLRDLFHIWQQQHIR
ncbi:BH3 interacting domain death agonist isoform X2 [Sardina pilchardus]|uniref:BH3 interacting domain death agonist isoform X2 n=1 Tax=Sardina pilchardus TaxID=27697 RepID=UPI002E0FFFFA